MSWVDVVQLGVSLLVGVAAGILAGLIVRKRNKPTKIVLYVAVVFFIIAVVVTAISYRSVVLEEIPDLTGRSKDEAELRLQEKELIPICIEQYSDTVEKGRVISQDLSPGLPIKKGSEVQFVVSKGPTPTPTPTPTPPLTVTITFPREEVSSTPTVEGTVSRALNEGEYLWIVVNSCENQFNWWPQEGGGPIKPSEKTLTWKGDAYVGDQIIGKEFRIAVVVVDNELNSKFLEWIKECKKRGGIWPPITDEKISKGVIEDKILDDVTVVRKRNEL